MAVIVWTTIILGLKIYTFTISREASPRWSKQGKIRENYVFFYLPSVERSRDISLDFINYIISIIYVSS